MTEYRDTILQRSEIFLPDPHAGPPYPGLGLPLQGRVPFGAVCYPSVASDKSAILSVPLPVRELAMMNIMDRLTDKTDWNIKVFDEEIVAKWRAEAKAIPDIEFWKISIKDKSVNYGGEYVEERYIKECKLEGIVNDNTFDVVSYVDRDAVTAMTISHVITFRKDTSYCVESCTDGCRLSRSFEAKQNSLKRPVLSPHWTLKTLL